jgi:ferredoxin
MRMIMKKPTIFYFTGTGNSLYVAKKIANETNGSLIPIAGVISNERIIVESRECIIVFPIHYIWNGGIPEIVKDFTKRIANIGSIKIVAVCTCGGGQGDSLIKMKMLIEKCGGLLLAGYSVIMPYNYISFTGYLEKNNKKKINKIANDSELKIEKICIAIKSDHNNNIDSDSRAILSIVDLFNLREKLGKPHYQKYANISSEKDLPFTEILPKMDKSFHINGKCIGCGICAKICPVKNVSIVNKKPVWNNRCEQCFACFQWCPQNAIEFGKNTIDGMRYHNMNIKISEMIVAY